MRIGIITFHRALNYGAFLQVLALQSYLRQIGADVQIIDYYPYEKFIGLRWRLIPVAGNLMNWYRKMVDKRKRTDFYGGRSIEQSLTLTRKYSSLEELQNDPPKCDIYICGSDQIWNPNLIVSEGLFDAVDAYFLNFGPNAVVRIAYAASIGSTSLPVHFLKRIQPILKRFTLVGVRESSTVDVLKDIGVDATWCCDPTILQDGRFYQELIASTELNENGVYCYFIRTNLSDDLRTLFIEKNLTIHTTYLKRDKKLPSVYEWMSLINGSNFIVTDSFHCVVFCLIFKKKFLAIAATGKHKAMNDRIVNLLNMVNLDNLFIYETNSQLSDVLEQTENIDWVEVEKKMDVIRKTSKLKIEGIVCKLNSKENYDPDGKVW